MEDATAVTIHRWMQQGLHLIEVYSLVGVGYPMYFDMFFVAETIHDFRTGQITVQYMPYSDSLESANADVGEYYDLWVLDTSEPPLSWGCNFEYGTLNTSWFRSAIRQVTYQTCFTRFEPMMLI